jgi:hypothetical protein
LLLALAVAALAAAAPGAGEAPPAPAPDLVAEFNRRDLGDPGLRRIRLELTTGGRVSRRFEVAHAWQASGEEVRSLVLLEEPAELRGTDYLLVEGAAAPSGLAVHLRLPMSDRQVLTVLPARFDEGLLGSDFGYTDLLWRIPLAGRKVRALGPSERDGERVWGYEVAPEGEAARASTTWDRTRYYLRPDPALLVAAEYFRDDAPAVAGVPAAEPAKRLRVHGWHRREGVWTPARMVMEVGPARSSTLTLLGVRTGLPPMAAELFLPAALPDLGEALRRGEVPEILRALPAAPHP